MTSEMCRKVLSFPAFAYGTLINRKILLAPLVVLSADRLDYMLAAVASALKVDRNGEIVGGRLPSGKARQSFRLAREPGSDDDRERMLV